MPVRSHKSSSNIEFCQCHKKSFVSIRSAASTQKDGALCAQIEHMFADFAENTSAHGIPRAYTSRGSLRRFLWLLLFLCCFVAFAGQAVQIVKRFFRNDIIVGVELKFENIPFPSVTVCNLNPYKNSLAREMVAVGDTLSAYDSAMAASSSLPQAQSLLNRFKRSAQPQQRIYTKYEGLLAVFSFCDCSLPTLGCQALKDEHQSGNGSAFPLCLCFYNQQNEQVWPCFEPAKWLERRCGGCTALGNCEFAEEDNTTNGRQREPTTDEAVGWWPCLCAPAIRICVRVDETSSMGQRSLAAESEATTNASDASAKNGSASTEPPLIERIPKIWELKKAELSSANLAETAEQKEAREEAYGLRGVLDPIAIRAKAVENLVFAVSQLSEEEQSRMGYAKREFITKCSFNGRECSVENDFSVYVDPTFGNCFTFNAQQAHTKNAGVLSERAGPNYGLRFQVFVNVSDYLPTTEAAGVRITVHSPEEQPFPDTHGHSAPTGFVSSFGIRLKRVNRLPYPYGECVEHGKTDEYIYRDKEYSTEGCQRSCIQRMLVHECGCGDPRFPRYLNYSNCPVGDPRLRECLRREMTYAARSATQPDCVCRQPCREQVFSITYSCARWPSSDLALHGECDQSLSGAQCLQFHREQSAIVEVYFEQLNYESLQESEAYGVYSILRNVLYSRIQMPNLLSDFGGQLGLWMGVSVITCMEVCILLSELLIRFLAVPLLAWAQRMAADKRHTKPKAVDLVEELDQRLKGKRRVIVHKGSAIQWIDANNDVEVKSGEQADQERYRTYIADGGRLRDDEAEGNGTAKYYSIDDD